MEFSVLEGYWIVLCSLRTVVWWNIGSDWYCVSDVGRMVYSFVTESELYIALFVIRKWSWRLVYVANLW